MVLRKTWLAVIAFLLFYSIPSIVNADVSRRGDGNDLDGHSVVSVFPFWRPNGRGRLVHMAPSVMARELRLHGRSSRNRRRRSFIALGISPLRLLEVIYMVESARTSVTENSFLE